MKKIEITTEGARGRIKIDGIDVSDIAQEVTYTLRAGEIPTVTVKFLAPDLVLESDEGWFFPSELPEPYNKFYIRKMEKGFIAVNKD